MLITRWQAPIVPKIDQIKKWFEAEGLEPMESEIGLREKYEDTRHPFDHVIMVAQGELILDIVGNKLLLREGDRIVIPSNTRHSKTVTGERSCIYVSAMKTS